MQNTSSHCNAFLLPGGEEGQDEGGLFSERSELILALSNHPKSLSKNLFTRTADVLPPLLIWSHVKMKNNLILMLPIIGPRQAASANREGRYERDCCVSARPSAERGIYAASTYKQEYVCRLHVTPRKPATLKGFKATFQIALPLPLITGHQTANHQKMPEIKPDQSISECINESFHAMVSVIDHRLKIIEKWPKSKQVQPTAVQL